MQKGTLLHDQNLIESTPKFPFPGIQKNLHPYPMKIGYVRVSDNDQTAALQIDALKGAGCEVIYGDHGVPGSVVTRKGLEAVLAALKKGDTLCVWKIDRLGRSTVHLLLLLDQLRQRGVDFVAITQGIDTTTAIGRMVYGQLAVFAEFERSQISERTKAGMAAARRRGTHIGRPPKLTVKQVQEAKALIDAGSATVSELAVGRFHVSAATLRRALKGA